MKPLFVLLIVILSNGLCKSRSVSLPKPAYNFSTENLIFNGNNAERGQFPHQIALRHVFENRIFCSGSIISNRWIVTAAHCTSMFANNPNGIRIVAGAYHQNGDGITHQIVKIIGHPKYVSNDLEHDISMIKTKYKIEFIPNYINSIDLPQKDVSTIDGFKLIVSGWGVQVNYFVFVIPLEIF